MSLGRAVPWGSWEEWRATGHLLLSGVPADVQQGLERVAAWRARGRVPLGVDSTACLVEAQQRDAATSAAAAQQQQQAATASESELRLQYAMAVVRMVNGIADSSQRGRVAASVASLASAAGLPRILVDLRHEATHNELPSMAALRLAAQHALAWLRTNYWQRQSDHVAASKERIRAMVQEYLLLHQAAAAKVAASSAAGDSDDSDEEDGRPSAAAAAVAAAASVSAGRKSARSQGGGYGGAAAAPVAAGDAGPTTSGMSGGGGGGGYQAADAKKRRKQLLAELRSAVPKPAAALLAEAVLDAAAEAAAHAEGDTHCRSCCWLRLCGSWQDSRGKLWREVQPAMQ
ncbi:Las1 family [Chlorella sorokiniana]|uniref:Las1 family n=1 Tax=Chlorella sorokiniana TaxID=3076 RepID=A0A2P6U3B1_CHLSO|nr:Las1 family [Chlorella sorokiniana]|eukprot:PRW60793.1 Las1 family [Chlorella sorokiniana]